MTRVARPESLPASTDRFVVVEASAGTGKTFFLEHRVIDLILGCGADLSQILLVTFTDKAVAELRMRIRDLLDRTARADVDAASASYWDVDGAARARLRAAVTAFDHAPIFTIHGFCHRILIEDAFAARRLFQQTQVADEVAFDAAFSALLRERFAAVSPDRDLLAAYLAFGGTVDRLRDLLLRCMRADARVPRAFDPPRAVEVIDGLRAHFGTQEQRDALMRSTNWKGKQTHAANWLRTVGRAVERASDAPSALGACDEIKEGAASLPKYLAGTPAGVALMAAVRQMTLDEAIAAELLPQIVTRVGTDKAEQGMFDYDDMLQLVRDALHGPRGPELAARLRTRMPWVMIDEFQDTDPVQWDIFRTVWMDESAKGLTIVGDPKQAIYGFRGADVQTYVDARDELLRVGATEVHLDVNRRSTAPLVEAVNAILLGSPLAPLMDKSITYDHPVTASGDVTCEGARPPVTVFTLSAGKPDPSREAHARAIGVEIERLRSAPPVWQSRGKAPAFSLGHCMILTRTGKDSVQIATALRSRGLPCALVESDKLFDTREASELAAVLEAIAAPRDRSARMRALRTRFFDVPWADLMRVVDAPDHHPLIARLFDWASLAARRDYEPLFRRLVEDSRFAERALVLGGGERALVNTWHLIELLLEEVARSRCAVHELALRLRRWINEQEELSDDRDVQRAETDADAIRILTIHKAKGLEAPYVFVFGAATGGPKSRVNVVRDGAGRTLHVAKQDQLDETIRQLVEAEADAENQRLAYVALTRAQVRLYLPLYGDKGLEDRAMYQPIQRCVGHLVKHGNALIETLAVEVGAASEQPAPADALATFDVPSLPPVAPLAALAPARLGLAMLSYTRLAHDLDAAALEPGELPVEISAAEFDIDDRNAEARASLAPDDLPPGADTGLLLHALFEHADLAVARAAPTPDAWRADPTVAAMLVEHAREQGIAEACLPHAARLVHGTLTLPLVLTDGTQLPPLVEATALARELEFTYPVPRATGAPPSQPVRGLVRGFIDALVAWNDELWILDYKSDLLGGDDIAAAATERMRDHYGVQARLYAIAADRLRGSRRLAGLLFAFVRHNVVVPLRIEDDTLEGWTSWLANLRTETPR